MPVLLIESQRVAHTVAHGTHGRRRAGPGETFWQFRQYQPGENAYFTVVSKDIDALPVAKFKVSVDPGSEPFTRTDALPIRYASGFEGFVFSGDLTGGKSTEESEDAAPLDEQERNAREKAITGVTVANGFSKPLKLATGSLHEPMEGMRKCMDELLTHWGVDAAAQKRLVRRAKPLNIEGWARKIQADYPYEKLAKMESGFVRVRLTVDEVGNPLSCHIQLKGTDDTFERTACGNLMRYAKFEPALDEAGKPVASYYVTSVIYRIY